MVKNAIKEGEEDYEKKSEEEEENERTNRGKLLLDAKDRQT